MPNTPLTLLYLTVDYGSMPGVNNKELARIRTLQQHGLNTIPIFFLSHGKRPSPTIAELPNVQVVEVPSPKLPALLNRRYFRNYKARLYYYAGNRLLYNTMAKVLSKRAFDFAFLRYPWTTIQLRDLAGKYPCQFVFEHNGKDTEIDYSDMEVGRDYLWRQEHRYRPAVLKNAAGHVGVTRDILDYMLSGSQVDPRRQVVISNGIDPRTVAPRRMPSESQSLRILFVASPAPWHGVDRLLKGLALYRGDWPIEVILVGDYPTATHELARALGLERSVQFTGRLVGRELDAVFDRCQIAVGSLALHRLRMTEGSTLKVREYLMRGIPFVLAGPDVDLTAADEISHLVLQLPATDEPVDMNQVAQFAKIAMADREHGTKLRKFAEQHVTMEQKTRDLMQFLDTLRKLPRG